MMRWSAALFAIGFWAALPAAALSDQEDDEPPNVGPPVTGRFEILTDKIFSASRPHLSNKGVFPRYQQWKRELSAKYGLDYLILSTPIFQIGTEGGKTYLDNELDLYINWRLIESDRTAASIFFWGLYVQTITEAPSGAFAASQGLFTLPNGGATDPDQAVVAPSALWWEQELKDVGFNYRLGQLYASALWGANSFLGDDRETFFNTALSTIQGAPWSSGNRGLGAMVTLDMGPVYVAAGFQDAAGDQKSIDFNSFGRGNFVYLGEVGITPTLPDGRDGTYKVAVGYVDRTGPGPAADQKSGWGFIASAEQDITDHLSLFAIVRRSFRRFVGNVKTVAAAGVVAKEPFGWTDDQIGVAAFFARPGDKKAGTLRDEVGLEAFWRLQLTPRLDFTPDVQLYVQPGQVKQRKPVGVFGARARVVF